MKPTNPFFPGQEGGPLASAERREALRRLAGTASVLAAAAMLPASIARAADQHAHHHPEPTGRLTKTKADYLLPGVPVIRMDGSRGDLAEELDSGRPIILNFMYTSCTAICPMTSQVFSRLQRRLSGLGERVSLVSISIDPEYDTPARLAAYAKQFDAGPDWRFYTGSASDSLAIQKAFEVFRGDKMNHMPVTFLRLSPGKAWVRIEGMASADDLVEAYRALKTQT